MHKTKDAQIDKPRVAFIRVHNSCRSQIAEALGKHLASDVFESYSAGTETKNRINPDAVRIIKQLYGIDMEETQHPKLLEDIPPVDIVITMGCNVECPYYNWHMQIGFIYRLLIYAITSKALNYNKKNDIIIVE